MRWNAETRSLTIELPRIVDWLTGRRRKVTYAVAFFLFLNLLMAWVDLPLSEYMRQLDPDFVAFFRAITKAGDSKYTLIPIALILPFLIAARYALLESAVRRMISWAIGAVSFVFVAVAGSGLFVNLLKMIFGRARPKLWDLEGSYGFVPFTVGDSDYHSFPSGHTDTLFALATALFCLFPKARKPLLILAAFLASSRVVITAHYLSDVFMGAAIGILTTLWLRRQYARRGFVFVRKHGRYRLQASGLLIGTRIKAFMADYLGIQDGARGRLP